MVPSVVSTVYTVVKGDTLSKIAARFNTTVAKIAADNNITVSADDINSTGEELASYYGYNDYQEILDTYGKTMNAEIGYQVLYQKVVEFVCDNVTINDTSSTEQ